MAKNTIFFKDVKILAGGFRNFSRRKNRFGDDRMNFNFVVDKRTASRLKDDGFNVREISGRDDGDDATSFVKVNVNFESQYGGPNVEMVTMKNGAEIARTILGEDTIKMLDDLTIISANIWINPYKGPASNYTSMYLERMEVFVEESVIEPYNGGFDDEDVPF